MKKTDVMILAEVKMMSENQQKKNKIVQMMECSIFAAILCILAPIAIPMGPVPVTLGVFAVMLTAIVLGWKQGMISVGLYILLGLVGLPVFAGGQSGPGALVGPTGGYIWSYLLMALVIGFITQKANKQKKRKELVIFVTCIASLLICYLCGTFQFTLVTDYTFAKALVVCVYPFIPFDLAKAFAAAFIGLEIRKRLNLAGFMKNK